MSTAAIPPLTALPIQTAGGQPDDPARVKDAAQQFEALLIAQLLKSASENGGLFGDSSDASSGAVEDLATQQFAIALARRGGLGLADLVVQGLEQHRAQTATTTAGPAGESQPPPPA
jgi:peptidoglycan hydrolase FlgJ